MNTYEYVHMYMVHTFDFGCWRMSNKNNKTINLKKSCLKLKTLDKDQLSVILMKNKKRH